MRFLRPVLALLLSFAAVPLAAQNHTGVVPVGTYALVPDSGYAGPDLTSFAVTFRSDSSMTIMSPDGTLIVKSKLAYEGETVTLNDLDGSNVCPYAGKYAIVGDAKAFKLSLIADGCPDRSQIVAGLKWVKLEK
ncbi:MAG: hypothetical protein U0163_15155 [Gemmatimonadaceae bacterium]